MLVALPRIAVTTPTIRPGQSSYPAAGPPPSFVLGVGRGRYLNVELTIDPLLFNGANQNRRTPHNFFSSYDGNPLVPSLRLPAMADQIAYDTPPEIWNLLRRAPILYYRVISFDAGGARTGTSLADLDYDRAPFVLVGSLRLNPLAQIMPQADGVPASGPPPVFDISAGTQLFYSVELATDPQLFLRINIYRRNEFNFFSSSIGMPGVPRQELVTLRGRAVYQVPQAVWGHLSHAPRVFYRAITARSVLGLGAIYSVNDPDFARAPFITVGQIAAASQAEIDHRDSGLLGDNPPPTLAMRGDGNTHFEIELATSLNLLLPAGAAARTPANYFNTSAGGPTGGVVIPAANLTLIHHAGPPGMDVATYILPEALWTAFGASTFIFYRVTTFRIGPGGARLNLFQSPVNNAHRMPGRWGGLPIDSSNAGFVTADGKLQAGALSSDHGPRTLPVGVAGRIWHPGIDIPLNGVPVYAIADGTIDNIANGLGWVRIDHGSFKTSYLHMRVPFSAGIVNGARVRRGQQLGTASNTGTVGPHLHFELENSAKNPLNRIRHTERHPPGAAPPGATLGPDFLGSAANVGATPYTVQMKAVQPGTDPIAIIGFGVSTRLDKDLLSVYVRILDRQGNAEAGNSFLLDYSAIQSTLQANGMLSSTGTDGARSPRLLFGGSQRAAGAPALTPNTRREFYIMDNQQGGPLVGIFPQNAYNVLRGGLIGAHLVGRFDMYVIPGFTNANDDAEDWFHYMWHVNPYGDDTGPHRLVLLATDLQGNSTALVDTFGVELSAVSALTTPAGTPIVFPVRLHHFDYTASNIQLTVTGVPAGWAAAGSWAPAAQVNLAPGGERLLTVTVTPPAAAAVGQRADVRLVARSARLPAFRDSVTLRTTVGPIPPAPRILANSAAIYTEGLPPFFRIESGADPFYAVEVSDRADFYEGSPVRDEFNYFNSRIGIGPQPGLQLQTVGGVARYALPEVVWRRLKAPVTSRIHYRVETSPDALWNIQRRSATSVIDFIPGWPRNGPEIEALHALAPPAPAPAFSVAPAFRVHVIPGFHYAVEVATDPELFDDKLMERSEHNFFSSWFGNSIVPSRPLIAQSGHAIYHLPEPAWDRLRQEFIAGRAARLHYIVRQGSIPSQLFGTIHSTTQAFI